MFDHDPKPITDAELALGAASNGLRAALLLSDPSTDVDVADLAAVVQDSLDIVEDVRERMKRERGA